jgi:hypothetical protein
MPDELNDDIKDVGEPIEPAILDDLDAIPADIDEDELEDAEEFGADEEEM